MRSIKIENKAFAHEGKIIAISDNVFVTEIKDEEEYEPIELFSGDEYVFDSTMTEVQLTTYVGNEAKAMFINPDSRTVESNGDIKFDAIVMVIRDTDEE